MESRSIRLAYLLGEMRREKNGAVADFMRFYGAKYGLNYGVSLSTVRSIARAELQREDRLSNHRFAKLLYQQEVRELRLAALWLADIEQVNTVAELDFWACGIINSEIAEEAAFALFFRSELSDRWLVSNSALLQYCAIMAMAKRCERDLDAMLKVISQHQVQLLKLIESEPHIIPKAVVALLDSAIKLDIDNSVINSFLSAMRTEDEGASNYIREEVSWRLEFRA